MKGNLYRRNIPPALQGLIMPTQNPHKLVTFLSAIWNVFRLASSAFQSDISLWDSGQLIGLPPYQGLVEGLNPPHREANEPVVFVPDMKLVRREIYVPDGDQGRVEPKPVMLSAVENRGNISFFQIQEMHVRYRLASGQSRLHSHARLN